MKLSSKLLALSLIAALTVSFSCDEKEDSVKTTQIHIYNFLQPIGNPLSPSTQGYWVQTENPGTWILHSTPIQGFTFEWGYSYDLLVEEVEQTVEIAEPAWKLIRIVKKTKASADATFGLELTINEEFANVMVDEALNFTTINGMTINCGSLCESFAEALAEQNEISPNFPLMAYFKHVNNTTIELVGFEVEHFDD